jgi:hypothetical protein
VSTEIVEGEVISEGIRLPAASQPQSITQWTPRLTRSVDDRLAELDERNRFHKEILREGVHYGKIPGTDKPTLLKPGAEQLLNGYGLGCKTGNEEPPTKDYTGVNHGGETFIEYVRYAMVYRQTGPTENDRVVIAQLAGLCNSWESKYRYRFAQLRCPECNQETVLQSRPREGEDDSKPQPFFCWRKRGGCGANFRADDQRILGQHPGKVPNENVAELANTILKMADKRAVIAATLVATGCSDIFTQDVEDSADGKPTSETKATTAPAAGAKPRQTRSRTAAAAPAAAAEEKDPERDRVNRKLFALAGEYERVGGERGADFNRRLNDEEERHALVKQIFGKPRLRDLSAADLQRFVGMVERRIDEAVGAP